MALHLSLLKVATGFWTAIVFIMMKYLFSPQITVALQRLFNKWWMV